MQGAVAGETCAVKLYDTRRNGSISAYFHEKCCLQALQTRASVVRFMVAGRLQDTLYPVIVTSFAGKPVSKLSGAQFRAAKKALDSVHAVGVCHGDIRLSNILFALDRSCLLAHFAHCVQGASQEQMKREHLELLNLR